MIPFTEARAEDEVGEKAKTLAYLLKSGFPVPGGFMIPAHAFESVIQRDQDPNRWVLPALLRQEIEAAYNRYVKPPVAVRSSCSTEDLESASFAGQFETIINVTFVNLMEAIMRCLLSVYQGHAQSYLVNRFPAGGQAPAMSIIVQDFVNADVAGVVFSKNPLTGNEDEMIVNSSFGLGEAVVSGLVTPDVFILSKPERAILRRQLGDKACKTIPDRDGTRIVETGPEEKSMTSLSDEQLYELRNMTMAVESLLGRPVDLEFAYRQGKLYILQARKITV
ncbi:PEP/pyruvate-binding domain-containing protein [Cohnella sp. CFH 77786]|uniref:PEP/pyruvate-binding domain-containing protein n=1 Tax=Cohnella sp. CFH 77786 TaxID=2662265 RepID=UPI0021052F70|nr:PEP/pyruvate-binding domain-containing protein [Cohnella sp. CFH 77786]